ncbi:hypothetical protein ACNKHM_14745 [Shigella sonnei]
MNQAVAEMGFSILWGLMFAYSLATLFYQVASYSQHPTYQPGVHLAVILFNIVVIGLLRRARSRVNRSWQRANR